MINYFQRAVIVGKIYYKCHLWNRIYTVSPRRVCGTQYDPITQLQRPKNQAAALSLTLKWRPMPDKTRECMLLQTYNVIWANQKMYHWLRAFAMFDLTSFPAILSGIGHHFKFCQKLMIASAWRSKHWHSAHTEHLRGCLCLSSAHLGDLHLFGLWRSAVRTPIGPPMRKAASVVWNLSLLMNSFNKTETAIFPRQFVFSEDISFSDMTKPASMTFCII